MTYIAEKQIASLKPNGKRRPSVHWCDSESVALVFSSAFVFISYAIGLSADIFWDTILPSSIILILGWGALRMFSANPATIMTAGFWFRGASVLYFGVGGLYRAIGTDETINVIQGFYNAIRPEIAKSQAIVFIASTVIVVVSKAAQGKLPIDQSACSFSRSSLSLPFGLIAAAIGLYLHFSVLLSTETGFAVPPSAFVMLGQLSLLGILLLADIGWQDNKLALTFALITTIAEVVLGVLNAAKIQIIAPALLFSLPYLLSRGSIKRLSYVLLIMSLTYLWGSTYIPLARSQMFLHFGTATDVSASDRASVFLEYLEATTATDPYTATDYQPWLGRLSYLPPQAFAVHSYDSGNPGRSLDNLWWVLVPRFLVPDKPNITDVGFDFTEAALGTRSSTTGSSVVIEGYFLDGWFGVFFWMSIYGAILGIYSRIALWAVRNSKYTYLPACLIMLLTGLRPDGVLISDVFGPAVIASFLMAAGWIAEYAIGIFWHRQQVLV